MPNNDKTMQELTENLTKKVQHFKPAPFLRGVAKTIQIIAAVVYGLTTAAFFGALWWVLSGREIPDWLHVSLTHGQYVILILLGYIALGSPLILLERAFDRASEQTEQSRLSSIVEAVIAGIWLLTLVLLGLFIATT